MNRISQTLVFFCLLSSFVVTNVCQAKLQNKESQEFILITEDQIDVKLSDSKSFTEYITVKNVALAGAVIVITGATCGAGAGAAAQLIGATAAPTVCAGATTGAAIGTGVGIGLVAGGGGTMLALKMALGWF